MFSISRTPSVNVYPPTPSESTSSTEADSKSSYHSQKWSESQFVFNRGVKYTQEEFLERLTKVAPKPPSPLPLPNPNFLNLNHPRRNEPIFNSEERARFITQESERDKSPRLSSLVHKLLEAHPLQSGQSGSQRSTSSEPSVEHVSAKFIFTHIASAMKEGTPSITALVIDEEGNVVSPLQFAVEKSDISAVELLLTGSYNKKLRDDEQAARWKEVDFLPSLGRVTLCDMDRKRAKIDSQTSDGITALHQAILEIDRASNLGPREQNIRAQIFDLVLKAYIHHSADLNKKDSCGLTVLHYAASLVPKVEILKPLLQAYFTVGLEINEEDNFWSTALHCIASSGNKEAIELMLDAFLMTGAKINLEDEDDRTPQDRAESDEIKALFNKEALDERSKKLGLPLQEEY